MFEMPNLNQLESRYAMNNLEMNPLMNFASQAIDYTSYKHAGKRIKSFYSC